jgi:hypothetical protein
LEPQTFEFASYIAELQFDLLSPSRRGFAHEWELFDQQILALEQNGCSHRIRWRRKHSPWHVSETAYIRPRACHCLILPEKRQLKVERFGYALSPWE